MQLSRHLEKGFWTVADKGLVAAFGVFLLLVIRILPDVEFGDYLFVQYTFLILSHLSFSWGMAPYVKYFYETDDRLALQTNALILVLFFFALMAAGIWFFRVPVSVFFKSQHFEQLAYFVPLLFLAAFGKLFANEIFRATHEINRIFWVDFTYYAFNITIILWYIIEQRLDTAATLLNINVVAYACSTAVGFWSARRHILPGFRIDGKLLGKMARFGQYAFGAGVSATIYDRADNYIISAMLGVRALALFGTVKLFLRLYDIFKQAVTLVAFPAFARLHAERRQHDIKNLYEKGVFYANIILFAMMIFLILAADFFYDVILAGKYPGGANLLRLFSLLGLVIGWQTIGEGVLFGIGAARQAFVSRMVATVSSLVLNVALIHFFGITGAAVASLISIGLLALLVTYFVHRSIGVSVSGILSRRRDIVEYLRQTRKKRKKRQ
ncbi:MAG: polysaccharide biosynthesis C-terminal domain-containing protein [candidate division KSB1 bacterium]|nr:polysaccharide biosynthesis C-terminal domain-containing protein [candidate division KSB1 bacterium]